MEDLAYLKLLISKIPEIEIPSLLVGQYLQNWALMEGALDTAIGEVLNLDASRTIIVTSDMFINSKIDILKCAVSLYFAKDLHKRKKRPLNRVLNKTAERNMIVHRSFFFTKEEGKPAVKFYVSNAKDKLDFGTTIWTVDKFSQEVRAIERNSKLIKCLGQEIRGQIDTANLRKTLDDQHSASNTPTHAQAPSSPMESLALAVKLLAENNAKKDIYPQTPKEPED